MKSRMLPCPCSPALILHLFLRIGARPESTGILPPLRCTCAWCPLGLVEPSAQVAVPAVQSSDSSSTNRTVPSDNPPTGARDTSTPRVCRCQRPPILTSEGHSRALPPTCLSPCNQTT
eukprot:1151226-Rhodomonas_salina.2